jgi:methionyl-tRNA synthetase
VVIYVRDVMSRYQVDAIRYFICAAGPENQDSDFTWREFVQRTNSELVAGWGNLVNRAATMIARNFGEIPAAGELTPDDEELLATVRVGFESVGALLEHHRVRAAINEVMRLVGEVNKYVTEQAPFRLKSEEERPRLGTILHVTAQAVSDLNTLLSPFLPHSSNQTHIALGGEGEFMPMPRIEEVTDLDNGRPYPVIAGDYSATPRWESRPISVGARVSKPTPLFRKLQESVVEEELARLRES